jgi:hypothetical protein
MLPDDLRSAVSERAHRTGLSIGAIVRKALVTELARAPSVGQEDAFLNDTRVSSAVSAGNVAERHDDYLYGDKR